jgi:hypothetical protein
LHPVPRYGFTVDGVDVTETPTTFDRSVAMSFVVPDACSLPTAEQPLRVTEFENLFATAARSVDRLDDRHVRILMAGEPGLAATVRDLAARENGCCGFFGFTVTPAQAAAGEQVTLDIEVPANFVDVLDGLALLAETASAGRSA